MKPNVFRPKLECQYHHAHIYFDPSTRDKAELLHTLLANQKQWELQVSRLIHKPIGPHPVPMFEADFFTKDFEAFVGFLDQNRNGLSILVHPVSPEEVLDHTERATWLGKALTLNIDFLEEFAAGNVAGVSDFIRKGAQKK